jgi:hypothetical protein
MLRKALELGDFARVFYVTHNPQLWEIADAQVRVNEDGQIEVAA